MNYNWNWGIFWQLAPDASGTYFSTLVSGLWWTLGKTLLEVTAFVALMLVVGRRVFPWLLWQVTKTGSRELFTLCVVAAAVTIAYGSSALFGVSFALGAFFAGMVLRESEFSHRAAEESLPLRDAFAVLFFVSVGMLFNPSAVVEQPLPLIATVLIIVLGKSVAAYLIVRALKHSHRIAVTAAASLAQIGEFSFILATLGTSLEILPAAGRDLILAGALLSILLNPFIFTWFVPKRQEKADPIEPPALRATHPPPDQLSTDAELPRYVDWPPTRAHRRDHATTADLERDLCFMGPPPSMTASRESVTRVLSVGRNTSAVRWPH